MELSFYCVADPRGTSPIDRAYLPGDYHLLCRAAKHAVVFPAKVLPPICRRIMRNHTGTRRPYFPATKRSVFAISPSCCLPVSVCEERHQLGGPEQLTVPIHNPRLSCSELVPLAVPSSSHLMRAAPQPTNPFALSPSSPTPPAPTTTNPTTTYHSPVGRADARSPGAPHLIPLSCRIYQSLWGVGRVRITALADPRGPWPPFYRAEPTAAICTHYRPSQSRHCYLSLSRPNWNGVQQADNDRLYWIGRAWEESDRPDATY